MPMLILRIVEPIEPHLKRLTNRIEFDGELLPAGGERVLYTAIDGTPLAWDWSEQLKANQHLDTRRGPFAVTTTSEGETR